MSSKGRKLDDEKQGHQIGAGRSIGRTWQGEKAELRDTLSRKLVYCLSVCARYV
jgi:hypothetical protein